MRRLPLDAVRLLPAIDEMVTDIRAAPAPGISYVTDQEG